MFHLDLPGLEMISPGVFPVCFRHVLRRISAAKLARFRIGTRVLSTSTEGVPRDFAEGSKRGRQVCPEGGAACKLAQISTSGRDQLFFRSILRFRSISLRLSKLETVRVGDLAPSFSACTS